MKKRTVLAALAAIAAAALVLPASPASAQEGTNLFVVHGLNLDPGGTTPVTVCNGTEPLFDFDYGDVEEVPDQEGTLNLSVWPGDDNDCATGTVVIEPEEFTPEGAAQALVATFVDDDPATRGLRAFALDVACTDAGDATATVLHATALIGPAWAQLDGVNLPGSPLSFGQDAVVETEAGDYDFGLSDSDEPTEATIEVVLPTATNTVLAVVGNPDAETEEVIEFPVPVGTCDDPGPDPDPDGPTPDGPEPDGPTPAPTGPTPVPAAERPLALTG